MKKRIAMFAALIMAFVFAFPAISVCIAEDGVTVPEGYDEHDYLLVRAFLEIRGDDGRRNGERMNGDYDPDDPETWTYRPTYSSERNIASWTDDEPKQLRSVSICYQPLIGELALTDCGSLRTVYCEKTNIASLVIANCGVLRDVSCFDGRLESANVTGCPQLQYLYLDRNELESFSLIGLHSMKILNLNDNRISELTLEDLPMLFDLRLGNNHIDELDISSLGNLRDLNVNDNELTELDFSASPQIRLVALCGNAFTEIDLSATHTALTGVIALGPGTVGYESYYYEEISETPRTHCVHAAPSDGFRFVGWYNDRGELVSQDADFGGFDEFYWDPEGDIYISHDPLTASGETYLAARFAPVGVDFLLGDANLDGSVTAVDALTAMRCALGVIGDASGFLCTCDIDADGTITTSDALTILRMAMGII